MTKPMQVGTEKGYYPPNNYQRQIRYPLIFCPNWFHLFKSDSKFLKPWWTDTQTNHPCTRYRYGWDFFLHGNFYLCLLHSLTPFCLGIIIIIPYNRMMAQGQNSKIKCRLTDVIFLWCCWHKNNIQLIWKHWLAPFNVIRGHQKECFAWVRSIPFS